LLLERAGSKGISTVAGATFFVVIMIIIMTGLVLWSLNAQREMNALDTARMSEALRINEVGFPAEGVIAINITNTGPESVVIIAVWVIDSTPGQPENHTRINLADFPDYKRFGGAPLPPGKTILITVPFDWESGHVYDIKLVTQRGRLFMYTGAKAP